MGGEWINFLNKILDSYGITILILVGIAIVAYPSILKLIDIEISKQNELHKVEYDSLKKRFSDLKKQTEKMKDLIEKFKIFDYENIRNHEIYTQFERITNTTIPNLRTNMRNDSNKILIDYLESYVKTVNDNTQVYRYDNSFMSMDQYELRDHLYSLRKKIFDDTIEDFLRNGRHTNVDFDSLRQENYDLFIYRQYMSDYIIDKTEDINNSLKIWFVLTVERFFITSLIEKITIMK